MRGYKVVVAILAVVMLLQPAFSHPAFDEVNQNVEGAMEGLSARVRRATCDLLSFEAFGIKANDSLCAAHCLYLGKRGGSCREGGVCYCRK